MKRIGFSGCPGTGKTTLALAVTAELSAMGKKVEYVPEYCRRYLSKYEKMENVVEQYRTMMKQKDWEDNLSHKGLEFLITDGPIHLGWPYVLELVDRTNIKDLVVLEDIFKEMTKLNFPEPRYPIVFHLPVVWDAPSDGVRTKDHLDQDWRKDFDTQIVNVFTRVFPVEHFVKVKSTALYKRSFR